MKVNKMLLWLLLVVVVCVVAPGSSLPEGGEEEVEELPQAEAYRQPMRNNNRQRFIGGGGGMSGGMSGGGGGGGGAVSAASYDLSKTYDSMIRKTSADNRMGNNYNNYNSNSGSRLDMGYSDETRSDHYDTYAASPSEYGGYGSDSGYGYSMTKYVDCNSAIALLSLILFIDVLRDVVEQLTQTVRRRKRRNTRFSSPYVQNSIEQFIADGGADALVEGLPDIVVPLLHDLSDAVTYDDDVDDDDLDDSSDSCIPGSLCRANSALAERFGGMGRVLAALLSNVVAKAFVGSQPQRLHQALEASKWGRLGTSCHVAYPCDRTAKNSTSGHY